jgi:hypothetical protein
VRVTLAALLLGAVQVPHMFWETPADQYGTWAHGVSWMPAAPRQPNLLGISAPALGVVSVAVTLLLSVAVPVALVLLAGDLPRFRRSPTADRVPVATVPVRQGGRLVERDLEGFLRSTGTTAFLAVRATRWCPRCTSTATGTTPPSARSRWPSRSSRP